MIDKIELLKLKLSNSNIKYEEYLSTELDISSKILFDIPAGRENFNCKVYYRESLLNKALLLDFDKYRFLLGYEAVWSKEKNLIEAQLSSSGIMGRFFFKRLHKFINGSDKNEIEEHIEFSNIDFPNIGQIKVSIGYSSSEFDFLVGIRGRGVGINNNNNIVTIKISGSNALTHDNAKEILEKIANSIFFQIDLSYELPIKLQVQRESAAERRAKRLRKNVSIDKSVAVKEAKYEYDNEPISLYWYAKESGNMPIFQYLAYYQSIEFYFPIYSNLEAKQKIQNLIKDPRFNANKDSDISKIISTIKLAGGGKAFGSEREQLRSTIAACTNNLDLLHFFKSDEQRFSFYSEHKGKNLSKQKISVRSDVSDFIAEVSERIYEIRCRIVHTKSNEGNFEVLLPYSREVKDLNYDIELIEYLSRKVLISSSRPLKI